MDMFDKFIHLIDALEAEKVDYVLIGGFRDPLRLTRRFLRGHFSQNR